VTQQDFDGGTIFGRGMRGEQQIKQRDPQQYEGNTVHEHRSTARPEQARAKEQSCDSQQQVAEQQSEVSGLHNHDRN
jgi:hypothetical protein